MSKSNTTVESTNPKDKYGRQKPPLHLIPAAGLLHESQAMALGAAKYGPYNWRDKTVSGTVYISAAMRHLYSYLDGEDYDAESGAHHLGHGRACLGILLDAMEQGMLVDDRPVAGTATRVISRLTTVCDDRPLVDLSAETLKDVEFDFAAAHAEASDYIDHKFDVALPNYAAVDDEVAGTDAERLNDWLTDRDVALADERGEIQPVKDTLFAVAWPNYCLKGIDRAYGTSATAVSILGSNAQKRIDTDAWLKRDNSMNSIIDLMFAVLQPFVGKPFPLPFVDLSYGTVDQFPDADAAAELDRTMLTNAGASADVIGQIIGGTTYQDDLTAPYVYVAGPMRGYPEFNFPAFDDGALTLGALGYTTISPAEIDRASGIDESQHKTGDGTVFDQRTFVYRDFFALWLVAHRPGGAIAMLPGWEKSTGAVGEFFLARWLGLKVLDARTGEPLKLDGLDIFDLMNALKTFLIGNAK